MLQFLCLQMCVYGWGVVPQGGLGDRHLVSIPQGVVGDRLPWGGERHGGGRVPTNKQHGADQQVTHQPTVPFPHLGLAWEREDVRCPGDIFSTSIPHLCNAPHFCSRGVHSSQLDSREVRQRVTVTTPLHR